MGRCNRCDGSMRAHKPTSADAAEILEAHAVASHGQGAAPLVFLHGFGTDQTIWDSLFAILPPELSCVRYDHMGAGRSAVARYRPERYATLDGYASDLVDILDALDVTDCTVVGHSVSGMISLLAAEHSARISRLVMIAASPRYLDDESYHGGFSRDAIEALLDQMELDFLGWARALAPAAMANPERPGLSEELVFRFVQSNPDILRQFARATFFTDLRDRLPHCRLPVTLLQPSADAIVPEVTARELVARLPRGRLRILAARGHYPHVSAPAEVAAAILDAVGDRLDARR